MKDEVPNDLKVKGRVLHVVDIPIREKDITKKEFTLRTNYFFDQKISKKNYIDVEHQYQFSPVYKDSEEENEKPLFLAYANKFDDWDYAGEYYVIPIQNNFVWGSYVEAKIYFPELTTVDLFVGTPVASIVTIRILGIFLFFLVPGIGLFGAFRIHPGLFQTKNLDTTR